MPRWRFVAAPIRAVLAGIAALVLIAACASAGVPTVSRTGPSPSPSTAATASPSGPSSPSNLPTPGVVPPVQVLCPSPVASGQTLALVNVPGTGAVAAVRDVTDISRPVTRCTIYGGSNFRFRNATHVSYMVYETSNLGSPGALYLADLQTGTSSLVLSFSYGGYASWVYNWSSDGHSLTYLSSDASGVKWHLQAGGFDRVLSDHGEVRPRGVNLDVDDAMVGFSADGAYVAVAETFTAGNTPQVQVFQISDGKLVYSRMEATMAAWVGSGAKLYFRTTTGLQSWSPGGGEQSNAQGPKWVHPRASADGAHIVFTVVDPSGNHRMSVLDAFTGAISPVVQGARVRPEFLTAHLVWAVEENECTPNTCGMGGPPLSGNTYIYDIRTRDEGRSILTQVFDSWPHVAGQS